jgi:hypothetical protein
MYPNNKRRIFEVQDVLVLPLSQDVTLLGSERYSVLPVLRRTGCTRTGVVTGRDGFSW